MGRGRVGGEERERGIKDKKIISFLLALTVAQFRISFLFFH